MNKRTEYLIKIQKQLEPMFNDENSPNYIEPAEFADSENATEFLHVVTNLMPTIFYEKLTGENKSPLEINQIGNRLCFQYALKEHDEDKNLKNKKEK